MKKYRLLIMRDEFAEDPKKEWDCECEETYQLWLDGEVYGFILQEPCHCNCPNCDGWKDTDSCWGFYTDNPEKNIKESGYLPEDLNDDNCEVIFK